MKTILILAVLLTSLSSYAQSIAMAPVNFQVSADHALAKFEDAVTNPEDVLRRFKPAGVRVSNKQVSRNEISFTATKTVLVVTKSVYVHGVLQTSLRGSGCSADQRAYTLRLHLGSSDNLVKNNVQELRALVCLKEVSDSKITGQIRAQIIKGAQYSSTLGPMAVNLIRDQVAPLLTALTEEIKSMR